MKSILGLSLAVCIAVTVAALWWIAARPGAGWMDSQGLFLAALPYNWTLLRVVGESNFSSDNPEAVIFALLFDAALAYLAGAMIEASARGVGRVLRFRRRA